MIRRTTHLRAVTRLLRSFRVVGLVGPRQVGKTTLADQIGTASRGPVHRFDLEDSRDLARLSEPMEALELLRGLVILDEVQHRPDLYPTLRVLADRRRPATRFLVLGSASPDLLRQSSESLAGRIAYYELPGLSLQEVGVKSLEKLWLRGGFPRSFLARADQGSLEWRRELVRSYLERDFLLLGAPTSPETMRRFWSMLAHLHGQIWNASELARSFGMSDKTIRSYLDFLASVYLVRLLPPWYENLGKRQVKSPKLYFRDSGILHFFLGTATRTELLNHPRSGASWEGFALETVLRAVQAGAEDCYFWATHSGAELDLLVRRRSQRLGFEFKRSTSPGMTPSMRSAIEDLKLHRLIVVHAGAKRYPLGKKVEAIPLRQVASALG
jgi:predicted AAA+ superfamily ATPase